MECNTKEELVEGIKFVLVVLFSNSQNREIYTHFITRVKKMKNWQDLVLLLNDVLLQSLQGRISTTWINVQIYKNFNKDFQDRSENYFDRKMIYNDHAQGSASRLLKIFDGILIRDRHIRRQWRVSTTRSNLFMLRRKRQ